MPQRAERRETALSPAPTWADEIFGTGRAHFLAELATGRFVLHDLVCAYVAEQANAGIPASERHDALHRMMDHCLHTAHAAALQLQPTRTPLGG